MIDELISKYEEQIDNYRELRDDCLNSDNISMMSYYQTFVNMYMELLAVLKAVKSEIKPSNK